MKRKRSSYPPQRRSTRLSATRPMQTSHKECLLLRLPRELRVQILQQLLCSAEPLGGVGSNHWAAILWPHRPLFTFYPAILRVCRQVHDEGCEILYRHNTAKATILLGSVNGFPGLDLLGHLQEDLLLRNVVAYAHRFTKWDITIVFNTDLLDRKDTMRARHDVIIRVIDLLRTVPNLNKLKVRLELDDEERSENPMFDNHQDFEDIAEQLFRPFSTLRVRQADFVDQQRNPIRTTLSLSRLMMSDSPPPIILNGLFDDLISFLDDSLTKQSCKVVKARLFPLEIACQHYDVETFRSALQLYLAYLSDCRGLVPPKHLAEFAWQDSRSTVTDVRPNTDWQVAERVRVSDSV